MAENPRKVFMSYSWAVQQRVIELAERLITNGIDVVLDVRSNGRLKVHHLERDKNLLEANCTADESGEYIERLDSEIAFLENMIAIESYFGITIDLADDESRPKNIQWGMSKRAENGTSGFYFRRCYGYGHDENEKLAIKPAEAEIVRRVHAAYLKGKSCHAIARELTEKGIPSPNGKA